MKRALIITYVWPPFGGPGVQRWLKFGKYMPEWNWMPVICTPSNPNIPYKDESLSQDVPPGTTVLRYPIVGPGEVMGKLKGLFHGSDLPKSHASSDKDQRINTGDRLALQRWLKLLLYNPDYNIFWVRATFNKLRNFLLRNPVDVIITTGPPHSMHLLGMRLKRQFRHIPWVADFRDPWVQMDSLQDRLRGAKPLQKLHERWERKVVRQADHILATSPGMIDALPPFDPDKYQVITNGFDAMDFQGIRPNKDKRKFTLLHAGRINSMRNPHSLWQALAELVEEQPAFAESFRLVLAGGVPRDILSQIQGLLPRHVDYLGYLPHKLLAQQLADASALLLLANRSPLTNPCIPGKVFEYFVVRAPILALSPPEADVTRLISDYPLGFWAPYGNRSRQKDQLMNLQKAVGHVPPDLDSFVGQFERRALTQDLCQFLDGIVKT